MTQITNRKDYEMHVRRLTLRNMKLGIVMRSLVIALAMQAFDDGVKFNQSDLMVESSIGNNK